MGLGQALKSNATDFSMPSPLHRRTGKLEFELGMPTPETTVGWDDVFEI
jgi:hypothetical protein